MTKPEHQCVGVIPARYQSTRFPGKPLADILGKPMIQWVYENVAAADNVDTVNVATDDQRIAHAVRAFGGNVVMTDPGHISGSDRVAEAVGDTEPGLVLNIQGDEPLLGPDIIDQLVSAMTNDDSKAPEMGTIAVPFSESGEDFTNPDNVKVVLDKNSNALYFSRAPIPYKRADGEEAPCLRHWGIYAYRGWYLKRFVSLSAGILENCEKLEQLRALEDGARIQVLRAEAKAVDVNTEADIAQAAAMLSERRGSKNKP